jgi:hypothetical protein
MKKTSDVTAYQKDNKKEETPFCYKDKMSVFVTVRK